MIFKSFIVLIFSFMLVTCCSSSNINKDKTEVPERLKIKADQFVISKTGKECFNNYIKPDFEKITKIKDGYLMVYNFSIPDKKDIEGEIRFSIDSIGNIQKDKEIVGIPECVSNPGNCGFNISKNEAINIAKQNNLEEGIKDWKVSFTWESGQRKYVWQIITTLTESPNTETNRSSGKTMLIDPGNGSVIKTEEWRIN